MSEQTREFDRMRQATNWISEVFRQRWGDEEALRPDNLSRRINEAVRRAPKNSQGIAKFTGRLAAVDVTIIDAGDLPRSVAIISFWLWVKDSEYGPVEIYISFSRRGAAAQLNTRLLSGEEAYLQWLRDVSANRARRLEERNASMPYQGGAWESDRRRH